MAAPPAQRNRYGHHLLDKMPKGKNGVIDMWVSLTGLTVYVMRVLTFLESNKNLEWLHSYLQTQSGAILFSEFETEQLHSVIFLNQTSTKLISCALLCIFYRCPPVHIPDEMPHISSKSINWIFELWDCYPKILQSNTFQSLDFLCQ
jgi:hypothetical protein